MRKYVLCKNASKLYDLIDKNPDLSVYKISKKINWTTGKTNHYLNKLIDDGFVKFEFKIVNGRNNKIIWSKSVKEFLA